MQYTIEKMPAMKVIGFHRKITPNQAYRECPAFWEEIQQKYFSKLTDGSPVSRAITENCIGEFGICMEHIPCENFGYMIAGPYRGGPVPEEMVLRTIPETTWAKFTCIGSLPEALQSVNTKIWQQWLPNSPYRIAGDPVIEWYDDADPQSPDYHSEIWLPVCKK